MKQNRFAIIAACAALVLTSLGLFGMVAFVNGMQPDDEPASVEPVTFSAHQARVDSNPVEPGQTKTKKAEPDDAAEKTETKKAPTKLAKASPPKPKPRPTARKKEDYRLAVLQIVTNFDQADVKVNGMKYPEYYEPGEPQGMVLPAGGPYDIQVTYGENTKNYVLHLRPEETRLLLVELSGYNSGPRPAPKRKVAKKEEKKEKKKDDNNGQDKPGKITVYSKPSGVVIVDGKNTGEKTPGSVELENGRHEVQVEYETGSVSEKKIVRVRTGSRIKLFFRERKK